MWAWPDERQRAMGCSLRVSEPAIAWPDAGNARSTRRENACCVVGARVDESSVATVSTYAQRRCIVRQSWRHAEYRKILSRQHPCMSIFGGRCVRCGIRASGRCRQAGKRQPETFQPFAGCNQRVRSLCGACRRFSTPCADDARRHGADCERVVERHGSRVREPERATSRCRGAVQEAAAFMPMSDCVARRSRSNEPAHACVCFGRGGDPVAGPDAFGLVRARTQGRAVGPSVWRGDAMRFVERRAEAGMTPTSRHVDGRGRRRLRSFDRRRGEAAKDDVAANHAARAVIRARPSFSLRPRPDAAR